MMKHEAREFINEVIVNVFTDIDEDLQHLNPEYDIYTEPPEFLFDIGQFYQWARQVVENDNIDMQAKTLVPAHIAYVITELTW